MRAVAAGVFTVKDTVGVDDPRLRVMVAAGTGSAPFVSMVRSELRRNPNADLSKWVLLHGASYPADLGYRDELTQHGRAQRLKYWGTVSRPKEAPDWKGDTGRVEAFFDGARLDELEQRLGLPPGGFTRSWWTAAPLPIFRGPCPIAPCRARRPGRCRSSDGRWRGDRDVDRAGGIGLARLAAESRTSAMRASP